MLGFKGSSNSKLNHRKELLSKVPERFHSEIEQVYEWCLDGDFDTASILNTKEQWEYCKNAMKNPPVIFINRRKESATSTLPLTMKYPVCKAERQVCRLCRKDMDSAFNCISCHCTRMYCHKECGERYLSESEKCYVCKQYYVYDSFKSAIHDCKSLTDMGGRWGNIPISSLQ